MADIGLKPMSLVEFLAWEDRQELRYEYDGGVVTAMTGGTAAHSRIKVNLTVALHAALKGTPCRVHVDDLQVRTDVSVRYPDVAVICDRVADNDRVLANPIVLIEVLSDSTANEDRGAKWVNYRAHASLQHYVMVSQSEPLAEMYTRQGDIWSYRVIAGLDASLHLPAIDATISLATIYEDTDLAAAG